MTAAPDRAPGRRSARLARAVLPATSVLAAAAVVTVVLSDDVRWLRLGVVAALWAALVAVWALLRRPAAVDADALQERYELELAAEVDARRAHEMGVERDVRRELEAERGDEIDALRGEIGRLRAALEQRGAAASPAYGTRLHVVGGSSAPDSSSRDEGRAASVADLRTTAIPSAAPAPSPSPRPGGPASRAHGAPAAAPHAVPGPDGAPAGARGAGVSGRTVAELLAAHAGTGWSDASGGPASVGGRRRRDR